MHHWIYYTCFPLLCESGLLATMVSDVWFEGSKSVRETSKLVSSPKTIMWILIVCVLFVVGCYVFFLLKLFALQNRLRKGWFLSLLVLSFVVCSFQPGITRAMVCSCHLCKASPALAILALLWVPKMMSLCVFLLWYLIMGKKLQRRSLSCAHGLSELLTSVV